VGSRCAGRAAADEDGSEPRRIRHNGYVPRQRGRRQVPTIDHRAAALRAAPARSSARSGRRTRRIRYQRLRIRSRSLIRLRPLWRGPERDAHSTSRREAWLARCLGRHGAAPRPSRRHRDRASTSVRRAHAARGQLRQRAAQPVTRVDGEPVSSSAGWSSNSRRLARARRCESGALRKAAACNPGRGAHTPLARRGGRQRA